MDGRLKQERKELGTGFCHIPKQSLCSAGAGHLLKKAWKSLKTQDAYDILSSQKSSWIVSKPRMGMLMAQEQEA